MQVGWARPHLRLLPWGAPQPGLPGFRGRGGGTSALAGGSSPLQVGTIAPRGRTQSFLRAPWSGLRDSPVFTLHPGLLRTGLPGKDTPGLLGKGAQLLRRAPRSLEAGLPSSGCPGPLGTGLPLGRGARGLLGMGTPGPVQVRVCPLGRVARTLQEGALPEPIVPGTLLGQVLWLHLRHLVLQPVLRALCQLQPSLNLLAEILQDGHGTLDRRLLAVGSQADCVLRHLRATAG